MDQEKLALRVGWVASIMGVIMFGSFIDQVRLNLSGAPGSIILPVATVLNCTAWILYGYLQKPNRSYPIIFCNVLGVLLGGVTTVTAIV